MIRSQPITTADSCLFCSQLLFLPSSFPLIHPRYFKGALSLGCYCILIQTAHIFDKMSLLKHDIAYSSVYSSSCDLRGRREHFRSNNVDMCHQKNLCFLSWKGLYNITIFIVQNVACEQALLVGGERGKEEMSRECPLSPSRPPPPRELARRLSKMKLSTRAHVISYGVLSQAV